MLVWNMHIQKEWLDTSVTEGNAVIEDQDQMQLVRENYTHNLGDDSETGPVVHSRTNEPLPDSVQLQYLAGPAQVLNRALASGRVSTIPAGPRL